MGFQSIVGVLTPLLGINVRYLALQLLMFLNGLINRVESSMLFVQLVS